jgi:hypothetical protein
VLLFYLQGTVSISFPIWIVKTYVVRVQHGADLASHERFFGLIIKHRPDLCQIGGMSSPDKKDSFRVIYFKNRALKDFKKTCQSGTVFPFIKLSATEKTRITIFVFKKDGGQDKAILSKVNKCRVVFPLLSQVRGGLDPTCLLFFVIATFCFYKKKYCSYKNSSLIFTLHRHFSGEERVFF